MTTRLLPRPFLPRPFLHGIALKTVRDRWKAWAVAAAALGAMLWWAMSLYSQIDLSLYTSMPDALLAMMNIPADADAGGLAYGAIYSSYGALTLAALALAMGASAVAGEERDGTLGLLLANPRSRHRGGGVQGGRDGAAGRPRGARAVGRPPAPRRC